MVLSDYRTTHQLKSDLNFGANGIDVVHMSKEIALIIKRFSVTQIQICFTLIQIFGRIPVDEILVRRRFVPTCLHFYIHTYIFILALRAWIQRAFLF